MALDPADREFEETKLRIDYLSKQYGHYTGHMNQVFNFYIVSSALLTTAFVQSLSGPNPLERPWPSAIAVIGIILSLVFLCLHRRGFVIAGLLDKELLEAEKAIGIEFMQERAKTQRCSDGETKHPLRRNSFLFSTIYFVIAAAFLAAAMCAFCTAPRNGSVRTQINVDTDIRNAY